MKTGDIGTDMFFTIKDENNQVVDLTTASAAAIRIKLNEHTVVEKAMSFEDRVNGLVKYKMEDGILTEPGELQAEVKITFDASNVFYSDTVIETVHKRVL